MQDHPSALVDCVADCWVALWSSGCSTYVTPGPAANLELISEYEIKERFKTEPAAPFPARIAVVRVQGPGYYNHTCESYGNGAFSVVTARDVEGEEGFEQLASLPRVAGLAMVNRLLLPEELHSVRDLRLACAGLHADMLLVYTFDTAFRVKDHDVGPLGVITLGFLPNKQAFVTTTASAALFDVRTGYIYGLAEATHTTCHLASTWSTGKAIDNARTETEQRSFSELIDEFAETWDGVLSEYAQPATAAAPEPAG